MKQHHTRRLLSSLLAAVLLVGGVPAAVTPSAEEEMVEIEVQRWRGDELVAQKQAGESYTTDIVGVREPASTSRGDWYWVMDVKPTSVRPDGSKIFTAGAQMKVVARYSTDGTYLGGVFDFIDATNCGGPSMEVTQDMFEASPIKTDPVFGYTYREVTLEMGRLAQDIDQMNIHIGTPTLTGRHTVELYGLSVYVDGELVWDCEGEALAGTEKGEIVRENIANATGRATGVAALHSESPSGAAQTLVELESDALAAGSYLLDVNVKTDGNYGADDKLRVSVSGPSGELASYTYNKEAVLSRLLGESTGRYDTLRLAFSLPEAADGQAVTVKVEAFDATDVYLRDVAIRQYTTEERLEATQIVSGIAAIGTLTSETFFDKLDEIEAMEAAYAAYVAKYGQQAADENIPNAADLFKARADYDNFMENADEETLKRLMAQSAETAIEEIVDFGKYNYRAGQQSVEEAEAAVSRLTGEYGEDAASLVSNLAKLTAARERLDYLLTYMSDRFTAKESTFWSGAEIARANPDADSYTTEVIGVCEPQSDSRGDWYWLMYLTPPSTYSDGSPIFTAGSELSVIVRMGNSDGSYQDDRFFELIDTDGTDGALSHFITREEYEEAPEMTDPNFGYTYKEFNLVMGVMDHDYETLRFNIGANTNEGRHTVEIYSFGVCVDGALVWDCEGDVLSTAVKGTNVERENIENTSGQVTGLVSQIDASGGFAPTVLADGITQKLDAGVYAYDVELKTTGNAGENRKVRLSAYATGPDGTVTELDYYDYAKVDVLQSVHLENSGRYDKFRFFFTVDEAHAGQDITLKLESYGSSQVYLRSAQLFTLASAKLAAAQDIVAAIDEIGEVTQENYASKTDLIVNTQNRIDSFISSYGQESADELITNLSAFTTAKENHDRFAAEAEEKQKAQDAQELIDAIDAIGEITADNYNEKLFAIEAVEALRYTFVSNYGDGALSMITNDAKLMEARRKYNEFKGQEPQALYGDINSDGNIDAADALKALQYSVNLVEMSETELAAADVDGNDSVNANDALLILQYSVDLIDRFPAEDM